VKFSPTKRNGNQARYGVSQASTKARLVVAGKPSEAPLAHGAAPSKWRKTAAQLAGRLVGDDRRPGALARAARARAQIARFHVQGNAARGPALVAGLYDDVAFFGARGGAGREQRPERQHGK
jgi:hypothetical protein